jgi:hypothetical protein
MRSSSKVRLPLLWSLSRGLIGPEALTSFRGNPQDQVRRVGLQGGGSLCKDSEVLTRQAHVPIARVRVSGLRPTAVAVYAGQPKQELGGNLTPVVVQANQRGATTKRRDL